MPERTPQGHSLEEVMVSVNEMQCFEPGCAPLETVVSLIAPDQQSMVFKIFKPVAEVTPAEAVAALHQALSGVAVPQHLVEAQAQQAAQAAQLAQAQQWGMAQPVQEQQWGQPQAQPAAAPAVPGQWQAQPAQPGGGGGMEM